jgi:hypothetical protein
MSKPAPAPALGTIAIGGEVYALKWSLRAQYRLQGLGKPPTVDDLRNPRHSLRALVDFTWACLPEDAPFATPADLAEALGETEAGLASADTALAAAFSGASPTPEKKAAPSSSPTPA